MRGTRRAILRDIHESNLDPKLAHTQVDKSGKLVSANVDKKNDSKELKVIFAKTSVAKSEVVVGVEKEEKIETPVEKIEQPQDLFMVKEVVEAEQQTVESVVEDQDSNPLIQEESELQILKVETNIIEPTSNKKKAKKKN